MDQIGTNVVRTTLKKAKLQKNSCDRTKFFNQSKSVEPYVCALYINHILFIYFLRETAKLYFKVQKQGNATKTVVNIAQEDSFCYSVWHEVHAADPLSLVQRGPWRTPVSVPAPPQHIRGSLEGAHLVLISARSRTTAITGADPSPVAGSEVWIERLPSWGSNMDWTACTTFSVMDSLWRGNAWWRWGEGHGKKLNSSS